MNLIHVSNHGALITSTDYWSTDLARAGKLFCSVNAGAIRLLLPPARYPALEDMRAAKSCVLSRGPWPAEHQKDAVEILFDDGSPYPFAIHLTPESFDMLPAAPGPGREWVLSVWIEKHTLPHKALERGCHWRRVDFLPWLKPWEEK